MKKALGLVLFLVGMFPISATTDDTLVKFKGGIGVIPVSSAAGVQNANGTFPDLNRNTVRGVNPPGQIWTIADLRAEVNVDGRIKVRGRGLLLAGGNNIGTNAGQSVFATLICETVSPFTQRNSNLAGVPLEDNGDFRIDDVLTPAPPVDCASPVLLIRNTAGAWFAAGIPKHDD
jgi:hypothetical protein